MDGHHGAQLQVIIETAVIHPVIPCHAEADGLLCLRVLVNVAIRDSSRVGMVALWVLFDFLHHLTTTMLKGYSISAVEEI